MNATMLRLLLSISIPVVVALASAGFLFGLGILKGYAVEVSHKKVDAEASNGKIKALEKTKDELDRNSDVLNKIGLLKSDSEFPEFRIVDEIKKIAANNNLIIDSFTYANSAASAGETPATGGVAAPTGGAAVTPATPAAGATSGAKTVSLSVTLKSPLSYEDFLQFTYDIEQNLPKMKLTGITISTGSGQTTENKTSDPTQVSVGAITIEMYVN